MPITPTHLRISIAASLLALASCGSKAVPQWINLSTQAHSTERISNPASESRAGEPGSVRLVQDAEGTWYEGLVPSESWKRLAGQNAWKARLPCRGVTISGFGDAHRVITSDGRVFEHKMGRIPDADSQNSGDWSFVRSGKIYVHFSDSDARPSDYKVQLLALLVDEQQDSKGRVKGARFSGEGFGLLPGFRREIEISIPAASCLRFATTAERILTEVHPDQDQVTFRVLLDDRVLLTHGQTIGIDGNQQWHQLPLPSAGVQNAKLSFEVLGGQALTSLIAPRIAPMEIGSYGKRPWGEERENIVFFLADTFRADNLAAYGGNPALTPNLNAFAEESLIFERVWSTGTSTLPAHISMFTGLYPLESGAASLSRRLPDSFDTIAERFSRAGYRTAAITDSVVMSRTYGFDQGFEHFDELRSSIDSTVQRAQEFLAADDGRPIFLFVQSYRAHEPYLVSKETQERLSRELGYGFEDDWKTLTKKGRSLSKEELEGPEVSAMIQRMFMLYHGASADLDQGFGEFLALLRAQHLEERGTIIVASDHGEAFHEHGTSDQGHAGNVWEEQVRVPLMIRSRLIPAGRNAIAVSLVDLAPTLADIAGLSAHEAWRGESVLNLTRERALYAFQCKTSKKLRSTVAIMDRDRKLILYEERDGAGLDPELLLGAFDLGHDPGEASDLQVSSESWPKEMRLRLGPQAESYMIPMQAPELAVFDADHEAELNALGYTGLDEEL